MRDDLGKERKREWRTGESGWENSAKERKMCGEYDLHHQA